MAPTAGSHTSDGDPGPAASHDSSDRGAAATATPDARARSRGSVESAYSDASFGTRCALVRTPPPDSQTPLTTARPCRSRSPVTGWANSSICISLCHLRQRGASAPPGRNGNIGAPTASLAGCVTSCCTLGAATSQRAGLAATKRSPSREKCAFSVATSASASAGERSSTIAPSRTSSWPTSRFTGSASSQ